MLRRGWDAWCVFWARARRNRNESENEPRQGGASTSKKLLAAIAVLAVAFAVFAAIPVAVDDSDAAGATYYVGGADAKADGDGSITTPFDTIAKALAKSDVSTIVLKGDVTEFVTIAKGQAVTLDLNGHVLTNDSDKRSEGVKGVVVNNGTLIILDSSNDAKGAINATNGMVAIANVGSLIIESGNITNTAVEKTKDSVAVHYVNYLLNNNGNVIINGGSFVMDKTMSGWNSSIVKNGWSNPAETVIHANDVVAYGKDASRIAEMTINEGTFQGPTYVKNDEYGVMNIAGGNFTTTKAAEGVDWTGNCVFNGGELSVTGGVFDNTASGKAGAPFYVYPGSTTEVTGGTYKISDKYLGMNDKSPLVRISGDSDGSPGVLRISVAADVASAIGERPVIRTVTDSTYKNLGQTEISVGVNSISTVASDITSDGPTFTYSAGKLVIDKITMNTGNSYVSGKVQIDALTLNGKMIVCNGSEVVVPRNTVETNIVNLGGTLKDSDGNTITVEKKEVEVTAIDDLNKALAEKADVKIKGDLTLGEKGRITVVPGSSITGTVKVSSGDSVKFNEAKGDFTVYKGNSIHVCGAIYDGSEIEGTAGDIYVTGTITGNVTIKMISPGKVYLGSSDESLTIASGAKVTLSGAGILVKGDLYIYGTLTSDAASYELKAEKYGTPEVTPSVKAYNGASIYKVTISGTGSIDLSQAQNPQNVGEDISYDKEYGQLENVTIVGSLTIKNNSTVKVYGGFNVNEGVTLTIEKGSTLEINSNVASMIVDGRIVVEEDGNLIVTAAKDVKVSGSIESEGTVNIASKVTVKSGGSIVIKDATVGGTEAAPEYASKFRVNSGLTVEAGAEVVIKSLIGYKVGSETVVPETVVDNKGTVTLNGAVLGGNFTVNMKADAAVVSILSVSGTGKVKVTDEGLKFADDSKVVADGANTITVTPGDYTVKGLTIVETVKSYVYKNQTKYTNGFDISGSVAISTEKTTSPTAPTFTAGGKNLAVTGELTLGEKVVFIVDTGAKLAVSGTVKAVSVGSKITANGEIAITGLVQQVKSKIETAANVSAAMYQTTVGTDTIYNYTTLKAAVDAGAKDITVSGEIVVSESFTIPAGVTVKNTGRIVVESNDDTDVVLTVADGASIKGGNVDVKGTLVFDNKKDNKTTVASDVSVIGDVEARYTNLYTALNGANAGETVTVDRDITLTKSITIKEGVTLDVPNSKKLTLNDGVTVTVIGTLKTAELVGAQTAFAEKASTIDHKSAIVVSGTFMSMKAIDYSVYKIPGAYYNLIDSTGNYNYVTTVENASKVASSVTGGLITINGKVTSGDVAFTGTSTVTVYVVISVGSSLTASSVTLDKAILATLSSVPANDVGLFSGKVVIGDASIDAKNVDIRVSADKDGLMKVEYVYMTLDGSFSVDAKSDSTFTVSAGKVFVNHATIKVTVASGATLVSYKDFPSSIYGDLQIDGTVFVASVQTINVTGNVTVNGVLSVADVTDTDDKGIFNVAGNMYVGVTKKAVTGEAVSVTGPVTVSGYVAVLAGADVSETAVKSFGDVKTTYFVEDKEWMTVYDLTTGNTTKINNVKKAPVENAAFDGKWKNAKGTEAKDTVSIGATGYDKVYAVVKYDIYNVVLKADEGVADVYLTSNGVQIKMAYGLVANGNGVIYAYTATVSAGTYTVSANAKNGWDGSEAKLAGAGVSGMTFVCSGTSDADKAKDLQLTGFVKTGYVDPTPAPSTDDKDDGLTITDYLLIVLVVLIVILAVIVAMRLMRS